MSSTEIYKVDIEKISRSELGAAYFVMSEGRRQKCDSLKNESDKKLCIAADMILRKVLSEKTGTAPEKLVFGLESKGKPYLENAEYKFSVSHSGKYVAVAVNKSCDIGIDVEMIRPVRSAVARHILTRKDIEYVFNDDKIPDGIINSREVLERFFKVWTYKEAFVKLTGEGITDNIKSFSFNEKNCCNEIFEDYCLTVITKEKTP